MRMSLFRVEGKKNRRRCCCIEKFGGVWFLVVSFSEDVFLSFLSLYTIID